MEPEYAVPGTDAHRLESGAELHINLRPFASALPKRQTPPGTEPTHGVRYLDEQAPPTG